MDRKKQSSSNQNKVSRFESSCPLQLKELPQDVCTHGLKRARWTADNPGYLAFEEKSAPGCPFGLLTEDKHSYCFFKLMAEFERPLSEEEVSKMLCLSRDQIRKIVDSASYKVRGSKDFQEIKELHASGDLFDESEFSEDIYFPDQFNADSVQHDGYVEDIEHRDTKK